MDINRINNTREILRAEQERLKKVREIQSMEKVKNNPKQEKGKKDRKDHSQVFQNFLDEEIKRRK